MIASLKEQNVSTDYIQVVGCDGMNVNTRQMAGVIQQLEESFNHSLQWLICLLHANELALHHLFEAVDGATSCPCGFFGCMEKQLLTYNEQTSILIETNDSDQTTVQPGFKGIKH